MNSTSQKIIGALPAVGRARERGRPFLELTGQYLQQEWAEWQRALRDLETVGGPPPTRPVSFPSSWMDSPAWRRLYGSPVSPPPDVDPKRETAARRARIAWHNLEVTTYRLRTEGSFALSGIPTGGHQPEAVDPDLLKDLQSINFEKSTIRAGDVTFKYVRWLPVATQQAECQEPAPTSANVVELTSVAVRPEKKKRGPKGEVTARVCSEMLRDLENGIDLDNETEETLAAQYRASRDTCRKARCSAKSEFKSRQIATADK
jgi:hypothetical protein